MNILQTMKYQAKNPLLKHLVKYYWVIKSNNQTIIDHKLLPVNNIDFVLNFSSPIKYILNSSTNTKIISNKFHFNGIRNQYYMINQTGKLDIFGISFFPIGPYPFLKTPLSEFTNKTIELDTLINEFALQIEENLNGTESISDKIDIVENELVKLIDIKLIPPHEIYKIISIFSSNIRINNNMNINDFCQHYGINQRKLERVFNKYIGISPKLFQKLNRFQDVINQIVKKKYINLISLAHENEYYDQNHFNKDFRSFTGCSPLEF